MDELSCVCNLLSNTHTGKESEIYNICIYIYVFDVCIQIYTHKYLHIHMEGVIRIWQLIISWFFYMKVQYSLYYSWTFYITLKHFKIKKLRTQIILSFCLRWHGRLNSQITSLFSQFHYTDKKRINFKRQTPTIIERRQ